MRSPRIINRNCPLELEEDFFKDEKLVNRLQDMGHEIIRREPFGNAQLVLFRDAKKNKLEGAADPRGEGKVEGF